MNNKWIGLFLAVALLGTVAFASSTNRPLIGTATPVTANVSAAAPLAPVVPVLDDVPALFAFFASAADTNVTRVGLLVLPGVVGEVDYAGMIGAEAVMLDPLLEDTPWLTECVLWNLHHDAYEALRAGNTNRFQNLQATYWRLIAVSKARKITTTR